MIKLVFDRPNTRVLIQGKGFDVLVLRSILLGLCQDEEILFEVTSILDWVQPEPAVQDFFDFILRTTEGNPTKLKDLFNFAVFTPTHIILPEHKQKLISEINNSFSVHEIRLSATEEEIEFNYSELSLAVADSPLFLKLGTPRSCRRLLHRRAAAQARPPRRHPPHRAEPAPRRVPRCRKHRGEFFQKDKDRGADPHSARKQARLRRRLQRRVGLGLQK